MTSERKEWKALNNDRYPESYGAWAGWPQGHEPNYEHCCAGLWSKDRWSKQYQCNRLRGHGPDLAYCKQHNPEAVKARQKASDLAYAEKLDAERPKGFGPAFLQVLRQIAAGHNDARGLATEIVQKFDAGRQALAETQDRGGRDEA